jgi:NADPH2:quinone reductase
LGDLRTKAIVIRKTGGPEVLSYEEVTLPPPGKGEVRVRHTAIGVNYLDVYYRTGLYPSPSLHITPGSDGAGIVTALGAGVTDIRKGDRVAFVASPGSYAEERNVSASVIVKIPNSISEAIAAAIMPKGLTA